MPPYRGYYEYGECLQWVVACVCCYANLTQRFGNVYFIVWAFGNILWPTILAHRNIENLHPFVFDFAFDIAWDTQSQCSCL